MEWEILEPQGFELHTSTYMRIFFNSKYHRTMWVVHGWLNLRMWRNRGYRGPTMSYTWINPGVVQGSTVYLTKDLYPEYIKKSIQYEKIF